MAIDAPTIEPTQTAGEAPRLPLHAVILGTYIPPHQVDLYREYAKRFEKLTVLISTEMERHRQWKADWGDLNVEVQRTWSLPTKWRHPAGFSDNLDVHLPLDTVDRLKRLEPDVIISSQFGYRSLCGLRYCSKRPDVPLIIWACVSEHSEQGRGWVREKLRRWMVGRADGFVVNGASGSRYLQGFGASPTQITEVPYSSPDGLFNTGEVLRDEENAHRLLHVGQLTERKGLHRFLPILCDWARQNPDRQVRLTVVGDGPQRPALESSTKPDNLHVEFLGWRTHQELIDCYAKNGLLVFPTLADEWGLVVNEAMASGMPVLGSLFAASVEELCEDGRTGWTFRPDRTDEVYSAIDRALTTSTDKLNVMRRECRRVIDQVTPSRCADRLAAGVVKVCGGKSGGEV